MIIIGIVLFFIFWGMVIAVKRAANTVVAEERSKHRLEDERHICYCQNCNSVYSITGFKGNLCPECNQLLQDTDVLAVNWRGYIPEKKSKLKEEFKQGKHILND